jgi:type III pantothenate kinase
MLTQNLCVDSGNSYTKIFLVDKNHHIIEKKVFDNNNVLGIKTYLKNLDYKINKAVYSSVADEKLTETISSFISTHFDTIIFSSQINLPFESKYSPISKFGLDRLALVFAAHQLFKEENTLIIDAGTCITYDLLTKDAVHEGGSISPGLNMRLKALNHFTGRLPLIVNNEKFPILIGTDTESSILSGVKRGIRAEILGIINEYDQNIKDLKVVLTGGDIIFFEIPLKSSIFAIENFLAIGLNASIEYQKTSEQ